MRRTHLAAGLALVAVYLVVAAATYRSGMLPVRPIYEGTAPPAPYQWVDPPPEVTQNEPPSSGSDVVDLTASGSQAAQIATGDGQAIVIFAQDAFVPQQGERQVRVDVRPLDPSEVGDAPEGYGYDGNAYEVTAVYSTSGAPARLQETSCPTSGPTRCATVLLRYPIAASAIFRRDGATWTELSTRRFESAMQVAADTARLGVFVSGHRPTDTGGRSNIIGFALGIGAIVIGTLVARLRVRRERAAQNRGAKRGPAKKPTASKRARAVRRWLRS